MKTFIESVIKKLFKWMGVFHNEKIIYFESFHGTQYSDNPRAIYEWMVDNCPEYTLVWGVSKGYEKPFHCEKVSYVSRFSLKWFLTMPRAKAWVINTRTPLWLAKSKKTTYIQTWHGTPLKKIGRDISEVNIPGYTKESYDQSFSEESTRWDYLVSPNPYATSIFKRAFDYSGSVLEVGYPRNDLLVKVKKSPALKKELVDKQQLPPNKRFILYAPTWRETEKREYGKYAFTTPFPFEKLVRETEKDVVLLVRMHYLVAQNFDFEAYGEKIINVSTGYDMSELLAVSDLLITDYSSCLFDFAITERPMLFFIPDQEEYEKEMRGFYFPMEDTTPGELVATTDNVLKAILKWQQDPESLKTSHYELFKDKFTGIEKNEAAKKVAEAICE
ncbi:CDP-glycerol glycerophosphotransferase family protein [Vagococcus sp.]|uniref:CDP-glycerol glycerophosphotransferase family protein n=1 Tax=Vagococcus sp. TaxID=1933889 RepID=UPI002FC7F12D